MEQGPAFLGFKILQLTSFPMTVKICRIGRLALSHKVLIRGKSQSVAGVTGMDETFTSNRSATHPL
jgi:hypothetical protein